MELKSQVTREEHQYSWFCEHFGVLTALGQRQLCPLMYSSHFDGDLASLLMSDSSVRLCCLSSSSLKAVSSTTSNHSEQLECLAVYSRLTSSSVVDYRIHFMPCYRSEMFFF